MGGAVYMSYKIQKFYGLNRWIPELKLLSGQYETLTRLDRYFLSQFLQRMGKINCAANIDQGISTPATMCYPNSYSLPSNPTFPHATTELVFKVCQYFMTPLRINIPNKAQKLLRKSGYTRLNCMWVVWRECTNMQNYYPSSFKLH